MEKVRLPDLETIRRFSIAVRTEHAAAGEVLEALRIDIQRIERAVGTRHGADRAERAAVSTRVEKAAAPVRTDRAASPAGAENAEAPAKAPAKVPARNVRTVPKRH